MCYYLPLLLLVPVSPMNWLLIMASVIDYERKKQEGEKRQRQGIPEKQVANPKQGRNLCTFWMLIGK